MMPGTEEPRGTLYGDIGSQLESGQDSDVVLQAGSLRLSAHRAVLAARSPVFAAMFRHDTVEASEGCVTITDISEGALRQMLQFAYTDRAPLLESTAAELMVAADKYDMPRLKKACEQQLVSELSVENAATCAVLGVLHSSTKLTEASVNFIEAHLKEVIGTDGWAEAMRSHTDTAVEICRLVAAATPGNSGGEMEGQDVGHSLAEDMAALLDSGDGSDVTLVVGGSCLPAHRAVLSARSPVLADMLREVGGGCVEVEDVEEEVIKQILRFMYTGCTSLVGSWAELLVPATGSCGRPTLKWKSEQETARGLTVQNVVPRAVLAVKYCWPSLKSVTVDFIRRHICQVMVTDGWKEAHQKYTEVCFQICSLVSAAAAAVATPDRTEDESVIGDTVQKLLQAAGCDDVREVGALLAAGADVDARDSDGRTALHYAAGGGCVAAARCLLYDSADVNAKDAGGDAPLHRAAWCGHADVVRLLVAASADVDSCSSGGDTPLHRAAERGQLEAARVLVEAGANTAVTNAGGSTPGDLAAANGHQQLADLLKQH